MSAVRVVRDFNLFQVSMVEHPEKSSMLKEHQQILLIDKYIKNENLLENLMNEQDIEDVSNVIEDVMSRYLFDSADMTTIQALTKAIAAEMHVEDFFDYELEASLKDGQIVVDLNIKSGAADDCVFFTASFVDCPAIQSSAPVLEHKETKTALSAYERAMTFI